MASRDSQRSMNKWAARAIPVVLLAVEGYASYVVIERVGVRFFLHPPEDLGLKSRPAAMIGVITAFFILSVLWMVPYLRVIQCVITNPGLVPLPETSPLPSESASDVKSGPRRAVHDQTHGSTQTLELPREPYDSNGVLDRRAILAGEISPPAGIEKFFAKDMFICDYTGLPIWCAECRNWKPDRTHHSSELGRCVRRMDHFCPWVGGMVGESNTKFFLQFLVYGAFFTGFVLALMAYVVSEQKSRLPEIDAHAIILLAIGCLFFFFTAGLGASTAHLALQNLTTVDNLGKGHRTYFIAVRMDHDSQSLMQVPPGPDDGHCGGTFYTQITYPFQLIRHEVRAREHHGNGEAVLNGRQEGHAEAYAHQKPAGTRFAILRAPQGGNPFYITPFRNMQELMGYNILEWLLPFKYSPLCNHDDPNSDYVMGPLVEELKEEVGLTGRQGRSRQRKKRRKKRGHRNEDTAA